MASLFMEALIKYNPYHDRLGRFATANAATSFSIPKDPKLRDKAIERERQRTQRLVDSGAFETGTKTEAPKAENKNTEYKILEGKSAREWGENDSKEWADNLSIPEREAIRRYTEQSYEYNNLLRRGEKPDGGKKRVQEVEKDIALIDKALKKGKIGDNVIVYRGTSIQALGFPPKAKPTVQELEKLKGKTIVDKGFMSTTLDRKVISAFDGSTYSRQIVNIEIHVPKGTKGSYIGRVSKTPNEAEILFPKGTKMKIKEVKVETTGFNKKRISLITEVVI